MVGARAAMPAVRVLAVTAALLTACTADPPPAIQSTETATTTPPAAPTATGNPVVVAIDDVGTGFNPHLTADQSPATTAVSTLVFPSAFRPVRSVDGARTEWVPDTSLLVSADVTSEAPFTVTYRLRTESQWSDGAPIAAEDFRYLWQQMIEAPGVVDPAGYAAIEDVQSGDGGKTVSVVFSRPYPAWRELFTNLVPSHLLKDLPGGFERGLRDNVSVSGGHFRIDTVDRGRDEILLERNDRFWGSPATPDQILLRRGGTDAQVADSLRSGDAQLAEVRGGPSLTAQLDAIPNVRTDTRFRSRTLELTLNGRVPALADPAVRQSVMGLLDVDLLSTVASGATAGVSAARAQIVSPSQPGYAPTRPAPLPREEAVAGLVAAGFTPVPLPPALAPTSGASTTTETEPPLVSGAQPLSLTLGAPQNDAIAVAVANTAADQLRDAGVDARVTPLDPEELYGTALATGAVDAVVGWSRAGGDPATALASRFGCAAVPPVEVTGPDAEDAAVVGPLSGVCDPALGPAIAATETAADPVAAVMALQPGLWALHTVLPIVQDSSVVAVGPGVSGAALTGPIEVGIFGDADRWAREVP